MTDMRATERLLEVIEEQATAMRETSIDGHIQANGVAYDALTSATAELRRRGDTLVRAADLRWALHIAGEEECGHTDDFERCCEALARLENALGGRMR